MRPCSAVASHELLGSELPVNVSCISQRELTDAIGKLGANKAKGCDMIPAELWKAIASSPDAMHSLLNFCNMCWHQKRIPEQWHHSLVSCLFKKGDVADCANYMPISLQCVIYKAFAQGQRIIHGILSSGSDQNVALGKLCSLRARS